MAQIGKFLQILALAVPVVIPLQLAEVINLKQMLVFLVAAICAFGIGRILEGYGTA